MSLATRIYLILVAVLFGAWVGWRVLGTGLLGGAETIYATDSAYFLRHAHELRESLRGRIVVSDPDGGRARGGRSAAIPEGALEVRVRARDLSGDVAVERTAPVDRWGVFEVSGLPLGSAEVAVRLTGGEALVRIERVPVDDGAVRPDPRIDPIDLGGLVTPFELSFTDPLGNPVPSGSLVWRPSVWEPDSEAPFRGVATIEDGTAAFLSTSEIVDVVPLVAGLRAELVPGASLGEEVRLGPGAGVDLVLDGPLPDPEEWKLLVHLEPIDPPEERGLLGQVPPAVTLLPAGAVDGTGHAWLPVLDGGRYSLTWYASRARRRTAPTIRIPDVEGPIEVVAAAGPQAVHRAFPMSVFHRRVAASE